MNQYITGKMIKALREKQALTQAQLAQALAVSDKTVSKWETGKGLPDIALIEPLARALKVSVPELMQGEHIVNRNRAGNMRRSGFCVCPLCGNIIHAMGGNLNACCGITLPVLEAEPADEKHTIRSETVENEIYVSLSHAMSKQHYISFIAYVTDDRCETVKLYPEQDAAARFFYRGRGVLYAYCNRDGLFQKRL